MHWLKAIRLPNLLIIAITQIVIKFGLINRYFGDSNVQLFSDIHFILLVLTTVSLALFAYLINDYFDYDLDRISDRKSKINISKSTYWQSAWFVALIGLAIAIYLAVQAELLHLLWIYPVACFVLYIYSKFLKSQGLAGNIIVALFTSFVIYVIMLSESAIVFTEHNNLFMILISFILFSFLINLYREIIKDLEDQYEDKLAGLNTLPIRIGQERAKVLALFFGTSLFVLVILFGIFITAPMIPKLHILLLVAAPLIFILFLNYKAKSTSDYHSISSLLKLVMISGLLFLLHTI